MDRDRESRQCLESIGIDLSQISVLVLTFEKWYCWCLVATTSQKRQKRYFLSLLSLFENEIIQKKLGENQALRGREVVNVKIEYFLLK